MGLIALVVLFSIAIHNWMIILVVPLAIAIAYVNKTLIEKDTMPKIWHTIQFLFLSICLTILVVFGIVKLDEIFILMALYYITFESFLNHFRGLPLNYIGHTSFIDKTIRKAFPKPAMLNTMSYLIKFFLLFAGIAIFLNNKPF